MSYMSTDVNVRKSYNLYLGIFVLLDLFLCRRILFDFSYYLQIRINQGLFYTYPPVALYQTMNRRRGHEEEDGYGIHFNNFRLCVSTTNICY